MIKFKIIILLIIFISSCDIKERQLIIEYKDGKQKLNINNKSIYGEPKNTGELLIVGPKEIKVNEKVLFKVTTSDKNHNLVRAYFNCQDDSSSYIDTTSYKIDECNKGLIVKNDTIFIYFTPIKKGDKSFDEITAIIVDNHEYIRTLKRSFNYSVND